MAFKLVAINSQYYEEKTSVLTNRPKISDISKKYIFHFYFSQSDEKLW